MGTCIGKYGVKLFFCCCAFLSALLPSSRVSAGVDFPLYPEITTSVDFWEKIYSEYNLSQAVIHDRNDLGIVYTVVRLKYPRQRNAREMNRKTLAVVKEKYRQILLKLADGRRPSNFEERKVLNFFRPNPDLKKIRVAADNIRSQLGQKERFRNGVVRSGAYLGKIREIFRENGLPDELAYLAHVESSYNFEAYSKAGAAGIWQFTRRTGRRFLTIDQTLDERRDPLKASRAAASLLLENFQKLGNWPMAITAYNHGQGGMLRAAALKRTYPRIFNEYRGRYFGFASRNFYAEFIAASRVAGNYRKYFGDLTLSMPVPVRQVSLPGYADVRQLAGYLNIGPELIRKYNPDLRPAVFRGHQYIPEGYGLRLPAGMVRVARLAAVIPESIFKMAQRSEPFYQVKPGDTVDGIANMHGVENHHLSEVNRLDSGGIIHVGQNLRIPAIRKPVILSKPYKFAVGEPRLAIANS